MRTLVSHVIPQGSFARGVVALASGTAGAQLIAVLSSPLLTRFYKPEDFGVLAVFVALLGVLSVVSCLRYELAIPLAKTDSGALNTLVLAVSINLIFSLAISVLIVVFREPIADLLKVPRLAQYLWILPIGVILIGTYRSLTFWAVRDKAFGIIARTKVTQALSGLGTQLGIGVLHGGPLGLITGQVIGQSAGVIFLGRQLIQKFKSLKHAIRHKRIVTAAIIHSRFPKFDLIAAGINTVAANLPQFLLAALFSPTIAGFYLLAYRVISMPVAILGQAVGQALYSHAREAAANGSLFRFVCRIAGVLALLITVPLIVLFLYGQPLFSWVFGADWSTAGLYAGWLILGASVQFVYSPMSLMLLATNSQHVNLAIQIFLLLAKSGAIALGFFKADPLVAVIALALADSSGYLFGLILTLRQVKRYQRIPCIQETGE
jgi:O-antigen/teichoic acid export membrane protein